MKKYLILVLTLKSLMLFSQQASFQNIIEAQPNGYLKIYFRNDYFEMSRQECSQFYMLFKMEPDSFALNDTIQIFQRDGTPYMKGIFAHGKREGKFTWYDSNGKISGEGYYADNQRVGKWNYYYESGNHKKTISYENNSVTLLEFYNSKGVPLVKEGNGHFVDTVILSGFLGKCRVDGMITNGNIDGDWKIYSSNKLIAKETFKNNFFIQGISNSVLGEETYTENFFSSFEDILREEGLQFISPKLCTLVGTRINANAKNNFEDILKEEFGKSAMEKPNASFFAAIKFNKKNSIESVKIITNSNTLDKHKMADFITVCYNKSNKANEIRDDKMVIPVLINNNSLILEKDNPDAFYN